MPTPPQRTYFPEFFCIGSIAALGLGAAMSIAATAPEKAELVGVVFAPWVDSADAIGRATRSGAKFVRFGGTGFIVVVEPVGADFRQQASADGALMFVDPKFAGACAPAKEISREAT